LVAAVAVAGSLAIGGIAAGTSGSGTSGQLLARGTADDKIKTRGNQPFDVVSQTITIQPGGHSGWHSHPGQAIVTIKAGTFTTYAASDDTCTGVVYRPGDVYVDPGYGRAHIARNEGVVPTEVYVTYLDVPVGAPFRIEAPAPGNCPF
ncbi:MAG TPA: cupin domain-containing protein, partial [Mycobacteriales bacterium]|nr:cupin domain-containing protein [Mycobacteriales bacterium]